MSEEKQNQNNEVTRSQTADDIANIIGGQIASTAIVVYVNSLEKEVIFREISVDEQKKLTRIMSTNERRKDIIYEAQCAMINRACTTPNFDIHNCSEFDRLKLMIALYQSNMSTNAVKFVCEECGTENTYKLDFDNVLKKLDKFDLTPKKFHYENKKFGYDFVVEYPNVKKVYKFHESYCKTHTTKVPRREIQMDENIQNMEYVNLFIKTIKFTNKITNQVTNVEFDLYPITAYEKILSQFPQDVMYSEDGILKFIVKELIQPLNDSFDKHECYNCGTIHEKENANQAESFF